MKHELLIKIEELEQIIKNYKRVLSEESREAAKLLKPVWEYTVYSNIQMEDRWHSKIPAGQEYVVIHRKLINKEQYKAHMKYYGSSPINPPNDEDRSVKYFVKHNVLMHDGGGYLTLTEGELCYPGDWEDIKAGKLEKYLR